MTFTIHSCARPVALTHVYMRLVYNQVHGVVVTYRDGRLCGRLVSERKKHCGRGRRISSSGIAALFYCEL